MLGFASLTPAFYQVAERMREAAIDAMERGMREGKVDSLKGSEIMGRKKANGERPPRLP
uniref:Uncharacterized protein n=1 Tax=Candidatus Kentrum sp. FW TaxID=2126338 RepID=A0A450U4P2_9GAMM|nr:MAG: hypothetical protein BECKFW1821C_GA0114237_12252 [Candidatus Kentron sp. FW]